MAINITEVHLLSVPLEKDYIHTLYFDSLEAQTEYFTSKRVKSNYDFSYQRKDKIIRYPLDYDDLIGCNYVMYKNKENSSKWYYAFITELEYVSEGRTNIHIETDVIQTWLFDYTVKPSFIEREHVEDDSIGKHTIPEMLETGEYVTKGVYFEGNLTNTCYFLRATEKMNGDIVPSTEFGGVAQAGTAKICYTEDNLKSSLGNYDNGNAESVLAVYVVPTKLIGTSINEDLYYTGGKCVEWEYSTATPTELDGGYVPKNNKLFCYPYRYLLLSNNAGSSNILQYELFSKSLTDPSIATSPTFKIKGSPVIGCSIKCCPAYYKGQERAEEEGLMLGKFPVCSWSQDLYTNWVTQNGLNIGIGVASAGLQIAGGVGLIASGGGAMAGAGMIASGVLSVAGTMGEMYQKSFVPYSAQGNINGGDINTASWCNTFFFYHMTIKKEYAEIIDRYFNMYGYKVNIVKTPNKNHRKNYWYTKTIDCNIDGSIPINDTQKIKECYNKGITFWKTPANIGNYEVDNSII